MLRKLLALFSLLGLVLTASIWLAAGITAALSSRADGITLGFAYGEDWLATAMVYSNGQVCCRKTQPNFTHHRGPYATRLESLGLPTQTLRRFATGAVSGDLRIHLAIPLILFAGLSFLLVGVPALRRARRRRNRLCLNCGYPMRVNGATRCSECGCEPETSR